MNAHRLRYSIYGVTFVVGLIAAAVLTVAQFNRVFTATTALQLRAPRAGLLLTSGSAVKMRGVTIGHVDGLSPTADGADIALAIMPDEMRLIPRDVRARIIPPTLFGGKYVELYAPPGSHIPIAAGATIRASDVTVEINDTFAHLMSLLEATKPAKVNAALTALATALQGRGHEAGQLLTKLDVYLQQINPTLGTLHHDLPLAKSVLGTYSALTPALLRTARNLSRTGDTIQNNQASLDAFLLSLTTVSRRTTTFVQRNEHNLTTTLDVLPPTERVLAEYAPEFPCFFRALVYPAIPLAQDAIGGKQPGLGVLAQFLPPEPAYRYPRDLPRIAADSGPNCYGLPNIPMGQQHQHQVFDTGRDPYAHETAKPGLTPENLLELFFGPLNGAGS